MKKLLLLIFSVLVVGSTAFAHTAFKLLSIETRAVKEVDLEKIQKEQSLGRVDKTNITYSSAEVRLVIITGPEDDMLSYRVQGVRNPNLVVPAGATLKILFINFDFDMRHDIRFGHITGEFVAAPDTAETAGSTKLAAHAEDGPFNAEEIVLKSNEDGAYKYFCSVRGHAKGGMWGNIFVGVKPGDAVKMAEKTTHVHSADEDNDTHEREHADSTQTGSASTEKPAGTPTNRARLRNRTMTAAKAGKSRQSRYHSTGTRKIAETSAELRSPAHRKSIYRSVLRKPNAKRRRHEVHP